MWYRLILVSCPHADNRMGERQELKKPFDKNGKFLYRKERSAEKTHRHDNETGKHRGVFMGF